MSDYGEIICTAIDQIVTTKLQGLSYDITKLCSIVDNTNKHNGKYIVTDGSTKFEAYSTENNYREGMSVLVNIPNGDFNMQKTIIGKQTATNTQPFVYTPPLDTMIEIDGLIFNSENFEQGSDSLLANDITGEIPGTVKHLLTIKGNNNRFVGFTRLGVSAEFKAWLGNLDVVEGTYGLKFLVYTNETNTINSEAKERIYELTLSSADMYGNPYNFESFFAQEKVFDISDINNITKIDVYFYQNGGFIDGNGNQIPYLEEPEDTELVGGKLPDNLFVQNLQVFIGYDSSNFTKDTLILYTTDSLTFGNKLTDMSANEKTVYLRWVHKGEDGRFSLIEDKDLLDNMAVHWYRYNFGAAAADEYSGVYWNRLYDNENKLEYIFSPNITKATEEIKVIGLVKSGDEWQPYYSDLLVFKNENEVPNQATVDVTESLSIVFEDDSDGNYFIYDQNGKLIDQSQGAGRERIMKVLYKGTELDSDLGVTQVKWHIPIGNSMMVLSPDYYKDARKTDDIIKYTTKAYKEIIYKRDEGQIKLTQSYSIKNFWSQDYCSNIVECFVTIDNIEYHVVESLNFGKSGTTGTDVTFFIDFENNLNALNYSGISSESKAGYLSIPYEKIPGDGLRFVMTNARQFIGFNEYNDAQVNISAHLYDASGKEINLAEYADKIIWSWKSRSANDYMTLSTASGQSVIVTLNNLESSGVPKDNYFILQATLQDWGKGYPLVSYLPIPIKQDSKYSFITGAKEVLYGAEGTPSYYKGVYGLYENAKKEVTPVNWELTYDEKINNYIKSYLPTLKDIVKGKALQASSFYLKDFNDKVCIYCVDKSGTVLWSQPILITQNQYEFSMLNSWDGSLTLDENNGTILSTMLGAGKKNSNNTFSGVLVGDVRQGTGQGNVSDLTGVYGLQDGVISYALREDGTASFGKKGRAQIELNGQDSTITSASYKDGTGMFIDLDDGILDIKENRNGSKFGLSISPNDPYFAIDSFNGNRLINIGTNSGYYLQSDNYKRGSLNDTSGMKLDLNKGSLDIRTPYSRVTMSGGSEYGAPQLQIAVPTEGDITGEYKNNLMYVSGNTYYLQSAKFNGDQIKSISVNGNLAYLYTDPVTKQTIAVTKNSNKVYYQSDNSWVEKTFSPQKETITKYNTNGTTYTETVTISAEEVKNRFLATLTPQYTQTQGQGLKLDLNAGIIQGYDLYLKGVNSATGNTFLIDTSNMATPLMIGNKFRVGWDGSLACDSVTYLGNTPKKGNNVINIADNFYVDANGSGSGSGFHAGSAGYAGSAGNAKHADTVTISGTLNSYQQSLVTGSGDRLMWTGFTVQKIIDDAVSKANKYADEVAEKAYGNGYRAGYSIGNDAGYESGYGIGYRNGYSQGSDAGYESGYRAGYRNGYNQGAADAYGG